MKTTSFRLLNILAVNLLLLALYLNFIHKDNNTPPVIPAKATTTQRTASVQNTDQLVKKTNTAQRNTALN